MARRPTLQDVEVVDDGIDRTAPPPAGARLTVPRRWWLLGGAVLAVLVAVGVTGQVVQARRESAQVAAVAAHGGGVALLDGPPAALWQMPARDLYGVAEVRTPEGLLVGVRDDDEGPVVVEAVDAATGERRWDVDVIDGTTRPRPRAGISTAPDSGRCDAHGTQEHLVVCLVHDGTRIVGQGASLPLPPSVTRVVVLRASDGSPVADLTPGGGERATSFATVGDLVVLTVGSPRGTSVRAVTLDGATAWEVDVPAADEPADDPADDGAYVARLGDLVALLTPDAVTLLDQDGRTVRTRVLDDEYAYGDADAVRVVPSEQAAGGARATTTFVRPDGDLEVPGDVVHLTVDDGSVPGLLLATRDGELTARVDGEELWSVPDPQSWNAVVLGGRVHLDAGPELLTLDARTGRELWRSPAVTTLPVTDGRHLLAVARATQDDGPSEMVALDPADGSESWRAPLPFDSIELSSHLGLLLVASGDGAQLLTVLG